MGRQQGWARVSGAGAKGSGLVQHRLLSRSGSPRRYPAPTRTPGHPPPNNCPQSVVTDGAGAVPGVEALFGDVGVVGVCVPHIALGRWLPSLTLPGLALGPAAIGGWGSAAAAAPGGVSKKDDGNKGRETGAD